MIGYQWSFSKAIQSLKNDIIKGLFGKPIRLKTLALWPRDDEYYGRNNWAGRIKENQGKWVLDSPMNNAVAHYLHNMFYVLGFEVDSSAVPKQVIAECYRANPIENYDTAVCRILTTDDVEILFYASHASHRMHPLSVDAHSYLLASPDRDHTWSLNSSRVLGVGYQPTSRENAEVLRILAPPVGCTYCTCTKRLRR